MSTNLSSHFIIERKMIAWLLFSLYFILHTQQTVDHLLFSYTHSIDNSSNNKKKRRKRKEMTGRKKKRSIVTRQRICNQSSHTIRFMHLDDWEKKKNNFFFPSSRINYNKIFIGMCLMCDWKKKEEEEKHECQFQ
jgi:hypothetical protein